MGLPSSCSCSQFRFPYNYTKSEGQQIRRTLVTLGCCRAISNEHYVKGIVLGIWGTVNSTLLSLQP